MCGYMESQQFFDVIFSKDPTVNYTGRTIAR